MARVHGLEHVDALLAAHLSHDDAIRPHSQGIRDERSDTHGTRPLDRGIPRLEPHHVKSLLEVELGGVLNRHDAFAWVNLGR